MKKIVIDGEEYMRTKDVPKTRTVYPKGDKSNPFMVVGKAYFVATVTRYFTGRLVWVGPQELVLTEAAWIPSTGRFSEFVAGTTHDESETFPPGQHVIIGRGTIIDMTERALILVVK